MGKGIKAGTRRPLDRKIKTLAQKLEEERRLKEIVRLAKKDLEPEINGVIENNRKAAMVASAVVLHDGYGFGKKRITDFLKRLGNTMDCLRDGDVSYDDLLGVLENEIGVNASDFDDA